MAPVGRVDEHEVGDEPRRQPSEPIGTTEDESGVDRAGGERLRGRKVKLRRGERADERQALAKGTARIEVRSEGNRRTRIDESARGRHRPVEEEGARGEKHADDVARRQRAYAFLPCRLEVVDGTRAELDRERNRSLLGELVAVPPEARVARTVARMPPPAAWSSSYVAPAARRANSSARSPAKHRWVWQSTRPGTAARPRPSSSFTSVPSGRRSRILPSAATRPPS